MRLPEPYAMITPYDGGYLAVGSTEYPGQVLVLDSDLDVTRTDPAGGDTLAVSQDGSHVAYVVRESRTEVLLVNAPTDGTRPGHLVLRPSRAARPSTRSASSTTTRSSTTAPLADVMGYAGADGEPTPIPGLLRVDDASEATGLVSGLVSYRQRRAAAPA